MERYLSWGFITGRISTSFISFITNKNNFLAPRRDELKEEFSIQEREQI